jgi:mannose-1-phosphate guanylyltransferase
VLLAGGGGTRFWPLSRTSRPKQLLPLAGPRPLILEAWRRARRLVPPRRLWVVAPAALARGVRAALPELRPENLVLEPSPRDTGPAVVLGCASVARRDPSALVGVFPTDHVIRDVPEFVLAVRAAARAAGDGALVCLGVRPDRPATGFGYLRCAGNPSRRRAVPVARFVEKPSRARARQFVRSGRYLWNAGMFVWSAGRFLDEARRRAPELVAAVEDHLDGRRGAWERARKISVDYAVMEAARGVSVVSLAAGWDDVGSWDAAARLGLGAPRTGSRHVLVDSAESAVFGAGRLVALLGVPGVVVVDTPDALLVVSRSASEGVRAVVDELRRQGRSDLL